MIMMGLSLGCTVVSAAKMLQMDATKDVMGFRRAKWQVAFFALVVGVVANTV